jgi:hypothetical protein
VGTQNASERAERALRLLCEARDARSGHLYLYQPNGLELAASRGEHPPSSELLELAERFVARQLRADDYATAAETDDPTPVTASSWLDTRGVTYQFLLLCGKRGPERLCAGVAVIDASINVGTERSTRPLLDEIASELLAHGDASGIADA